MRRLAVQRDLWKEAFQHWPQLPCPTCKVGLLAVEQKKIIKEETTDSKKSYGHDAWEPDWIEKRFVAGLKCGNPVCADKIVSCGVISHEYYQFYHDDGSVGGDLIETFMPHYFEPAPPVFSMHESYPEIVCAELLKSFSLMWADVAAAATRVRVSVEFLMDELKIPRKAKIKSGKNTGKYREVTLDERIRKFSELNNDAGKQLMAVKWLGNTASHKSVSQFTRDDLLDSFEHIEFALDLIYVKTIARLAERADKILKIKGPIKNKL